MNLILAGVWVIVAVVFFARSFQEPENHYNQLLGLMAILMVAYNLVRWWNWKQYYSQKRQPPRTLPPRPIVKRDEDEEQAKE